jgi:hypothetical protein
MKHWPVRLAVWVLTLALCPAALTIPRALRAGSSSEAFPFSVTEIQLIWEPSGFFDEIMRPALPPEEPLRLHWSDRVLIRLVDAESRESDAWFRDDYRVARVTLGLARHGSPIPHIEATYKVLGCHPDQVWPRIEARRQALLAADYHKVFGEMVSPRKPARSVPLGRVRAAEHRCVAPALV